VRQPSWWTRLRWYLGWLNGPPDDPDWDATDWAHPAWWRGEEHGIGMTVLLVTEMLDGEDDGAWVYGNAALEQLRRRILNLRKDTHGSGVIQSQEKYGTGDHSGEPGSGGGDRGGG
jgi:hypothetical protein